MDRTDAPWKRLEPMLPKPHRRPDGRGRPWRDPRDVLNGVLWVMRTGAPWHDLPGREVAPQF
jgi:transposase